MPARRGSDKPGEIGEFRLCSGIGLLRYPHGEKRSQNRNKCVEPYSSPIWVSGQWGQGSRGPEEGGPTLFITAKHGVRKLKEELGTGDNHDHADCQRLKRGYYYQTRVLNLKNAKSGKKALT